jgi:hypothetical protein
MAKTIDPPRLCSGCKKSGWHKTLTTKELVRSATGDERIREIVREELRRLPASPVDVVAPIRPAVKMNDAMAAFLSAVPVAAPKPEPAATPVAICCYQAYNEVDGEYYLCQLAPHSSKVPHGAWRKL